MIVHSMDRFARSLKDLVTEVDKLVKRGIAIQFVKENITFTAQSTPMDNLMLQLMGAFAEFERNRIRERTTEGLARAKAEGKKLGRPEATGTTEQVQKCKADGLSQSETARALDVGIATVKRHWNKTI